MTTLREAAQQALEALEGVFEGDEKGAQYWTVTGGTYEAVYCKHAITALKAALEQPEEKPVAWVITDEDINSLQVASIQRLIDRLKHAHHTDLRVRINGQDEWFQADWIKHLQRAQPPRHEWRGLTEEDMIDIQDRCGVTILRDEFLAIEAKLKERNA